MTDLEVGRYEDFRRRLTAAKADAAFEHDWFTYEVFMDKIELWDFVHEQGFEYQRQN